MSQLQGDRSLHYRGTYSFLFTCLVTMALRAWPAMHLNLPEADEGSAPFWRSKQLRRKIGWVFLGLFAPEFVAWTAFKQHKQAINLDRDVKFWLHQPESEPFLRRLRKKIRITPCLNRVKDIIRADVEPLPSRSANPQRQYGHPWSIVDSYYSVMGGFAVDTNTMPLEIKNTPYGNKWLTLTWASVHLLIDRKPHFLPSLSREQIEDKAKANSLAKTIVCFQATWFCFQCLTRVIQGLFISVLELRVFGHTLCALLIYVLWWHKPLDISEPNSEGEGVEEIVALVFMISGIDPFSSLTDIK